MALLTASHRPAKSTCGRLNDERLTRPVCGRFPL